MVNAKLVALVPCADVASNPAGRLSILNVLPAFRPVGDYPLVVPNLAVVTWWAGESEAVESVTASISVVSPDRNEVLAEAGFTFQIGGGILTHAQVTLFDSLVLPEPGVYRLVATAGNSALADVPLLAAPAAPADAGGAADAGHGG